MEQALDLSPLGLFLNASLVGKAVMAVLFLASIWCWVLIIEGRISVVPPSPRRPDCESRRRNFHLPRQRRRRRR